MFLFNIFSLKSRFTKSRLKLLKCIKHEKRVSQLFAYNHNGGVGLIEMVLGIF